MFFFFGWIQWSNDIEKSSTPFFFWLDPMVFFSNHLFEHYKKINMPASLYFLQRKMGIFTYKDWMGWGPLTLAEFLLILGKKGPFHFQGKKFYYEWRAKGPMNIVAWESEWMSEGWMNEPRVAALLSNSYWIHMEKGAFFSLNSLNFLSFRYHWIPPIHGLFKKKFQWGISLLSNSYWILTE